MDPRILFFAVFLSAVCTSNSRILSRRLRNGEPCHTPGFFGDAEDCRKFYRCAEHPTDDENNPELIRYTFRCPSGTVFDETLSTCNHADAVLDKPANCQVYDPEDESGNNNGVYVGSSAIAYGTSGTLDQVLTLANNPQQQQTLLVPVNQVFHPSFGLPNLIQYG